MDRDSAKREIKSRYAEILQPAKVKNTYICPICGNGTGSTGDGLRVDPNSDGTALKCFKCGFYGDIIDLYQKEHNCDAAQAFTALYDHFGIVIDDTTPAPVRKAAPKAPAQPKQESKTDYTDYYAQCAKSSADAQRYLKSRGIGQMTADRYSIGYDSKTGYVIIPVTKYFYIARNTDSTAQMRYKNPKGASIDIFNKEEALYTRERPVFVTEGTIDALSIIEAGGEAIALNSADNYKKLLDDLKARRTDNPIILALDNDDAGRVHQKLLGDGLRALEIPFICADLYGESKDANEALLADRQQLIKAMHRAEKIAAELPRPLRAIDASSYLVSGTYEADIEYFKAYKNRKTGFRNLDDYVTLYPGLAVLGGASSLGKTTFIVNMIDRLLEKGETVLFFSLEQLPIEIMTKSLTRSLSENYPEARLTNIDIKNGMTCPELEEIKKDYSIKSERYHIITGSFRTTAADIERYVERYRAKHGGEECKPIVIIDYLQLIAPPAKFKGGIREYIDENIKSLKNMQKKNGLFVLVVSNFNRSSNYEPVSYESFKETSMIEYTCDYVWGLQLSILDAENDDFYTVIGSKGGRSERPIDQKRKLINEAQSENPKQVELVSLKNRNGRQFFKVFFQYYPQFDCYIPAQNPYN